MIDDRSKYEIKHQCSLWHVWTVFARVEDDGVITYGNTLDALCPHCRNNETNRSQAHAGAVGIVLPMGMAAPKVYHVCINPKCISPLKKMYTPMVQVPSITLTVDDQRVGRTYWRIPTPFPQYCPDCTKSIIGDGAQRLIAKGQW